MILIELLCPEQKQGKFEQKEYKKKFSFKHAEIILNKGNWKLPENSQWVFKDKVLIKKAKKPKTEE